MPFHLLRLGWQRSSSSSSSAQCLTPPSLDGSQAIKGSIPDQSSPAPSVAGTASRPPNRVADRIRAINSIQQLSSTASFSPPGPDQQRLSPFPRRDAAQTPVRPQTPLSLSKPVVNPLVHCPMPKRIQPQLSTAIEQCTVSIPSGPSMCQRHGRQLKAKRSASTGVEKGYSGAYVVTGLRLRQQVDPISPWAVRRRLAKTSGTTVSPDICPDCLAEREILRREFEADTGMHFDKLEPSAPSASSSTQTERGTPLDPQQPPNILIGSTADNQTVTSAGATIAESPPNKFGSIVATDLGDMIDAIIVEHKGTLGKVISNIRNGMPDADWTGNLSRDLTKVSEAVASLPEDNIKSAPAFSRNINGRRSVILDTSPEALKDRARTMPELLDLLDAATEQFGLGHSDQVKDVVTAKSIQIPGNFPPTNPSTTSVSAGSVSTPPLTIAGLVSPLPSSPAIELSCDADSSDEVQSLNEESPDTKTTIMIAPPPANMEEAEATVLEGAPSMPVVAVPQQQATQESAPTETTMKIQQPSQQKEPKLRAKSIPAVKPLYTGTGKVRGPIRPKPSDVAQQQKQQRTFQQTWLRDAVSAERADRRSRSGNANKT